MISSSDENLDEYVPEENKRLRWLTNFSVRMVLHLFQKKIFFY